MILDFSITMPIHIPMNRLSEYTFTTLSIFTIKLLIIKHFIISTISLLFSKTAIYSNRCNSTAEVTSIEIV